LFVESEPVGHRGRFSAAGDGVQVKPSIRTFAYPDLEL
jgi:hypothetical protein